MKQRPIKIYIEHMTNGQFDVLQRWPSYPERYDPPRLVRRVDTEDQAAAFAHRYAAAIQELGLSVVVLSDEEALAESLGYVPGHTIDIPHEHLPALG